MLLQLFFTTFILASEASLVAEPPSIATPCTLSGGSVDASGVTTIDGSGSATIRCTSAGEIIITTGTDEIRRSVTSDADVVIPAPSLSSGREISFSFVGPNLNPEIFARARVLSDYSISGKGQFLVTPGSKTIPLLQADDEIMIVAGSTHPIGVEFRFSDAVSIGRPVVPAPDASGIYTVRVPRTIPPDALVSIALCDPSVACDGSKRVRQFRMKAKRPIVQVYRSSKPNPADDEADLLSLTSPQLLEFKDFLFVVVAQGVRVEKFGLRPTDAKSSAPSFDLTTDMVEMKNCPPAFVERLQRSFQRQQQTKATGAEAHVSEGVPEQASDVVCHSVQLGRSFRRVEHHEALVVAVQTSIDAPASASTTTEFAAQKRRVFSLYRSLDGKLPAVFFPVAIFGTNFKSRSDGSGIPIMAVPVAAAAGVRLSVTKRFYVGFAGFLGWSIQPNTSATSIARPYPGRGEGVQVGTTRGGGTADFGTRESSTLKQKVTVASITTGLLLDINNYITVGPAWLFDFTRPGNAYAGPLFVFGAAPDLINLLKTPRGK